MVELDREGDFDNPVVWSCKMPNCAVGNGGLSRACRSSGSMLSGISLHATEWHKCLACTYHERPSRDAHGQAEVTLCQDGGMKPWM